MTDNVNTRELGDDAMKWAEAFCRIVREHNPEIDEGFMLGWFANAIECSYDVRYARLQRTAIQWRRVEDEFCWPKECGKYLVRFCGETEYAAWTGSGFINRDGFYMTGVEWYAPMPGGPGE